MATKKAAQAQKKLELVQDVFIKAEDVLLKKETKKPTAKVEKVLLYIEKYKRDAYEACVDLYILFKVNPRNYHTLGVIEFIKKKVRSLAFPPIATQEKKIVARQQTLFQQT